MWSKYMAYVVLPKNSKIFLNLSWINISNATNNNNTDGKNRKILKFPTKENKINITDSNSKYNFLLTLS